MTRYEEMLTKTRAWHTRTITFLYALILCLAVTGCEEAKPETAGKQQNNPPSAPSQNTPASSTPAQADKQVRVVFLGDSLTAGYGLEQQEAFPARVAEALEKQGLPVSVVNAGVSGDTTAGGLRRIDWVLKQKPDIVVVGLGANDGLRAQDTKASEESLREIIRKSQAADADVLLLGMLIPPNYGPEYTGKFREIYPRLAGELSVPLVPFLLEGVAGDPSLNLPDGIHPTAAGHEIVAKNVLPQIQSLVKKRLEKRD